MAKGDKAQLDTKLNTDLKKLKRGDLLELLYDQVRDNEEKTAAVAELTEQNAQLKISINRKEIQVEGLEERLAHLEKRVAELQEANDLYARTVDVVDYRELLKYQEKAVMEYLFSVAEKKLDE